MSDIKLFRLVEGTATQLQGKSVILERKLQQRIEQNLEASLGVRLLASEYSTGRLHGGRIVGATNGVRPVLSSVR